MMQVKHTETGSVYTLTATNPENERVVEQMVGKAMCAYANWMQVIDKKGGGRAEYWTLEQQVSHERLIAMYASEYEATARCVSMLVSQPLISVCNYIVVKAHEELGV